MSKISYQLVATPTGLASVSTIPACKVNQLVQVAQKCQSTIAESGCDGVSQQDLQISELVNSMKDFIEFGRENKVGPIESLQVYPRHTNATKLQMQRMQEMEQLASVQGMPTDTNALNKPMVITTSAWPVEEL